MEQDRWVVRFIQGVSARGYFVEVGANDGVHLSNTLLLENRYGWNGLCIEANPYLFRELRTNRRCCCLNVLVGDDDLEHSFVCAGDLGRVLTQGEETSVANKVLRLRSQTLARILHDNAAPPIIDYLSVDVEGHEENVLLGFPFERYRFLSMTIERPSPVLLEVLSRHGYSRVHEIPDADSTFIHETMRAEYCRRSMPHWNLILLKIYGLIVRLDRRLQREELN